MPMQNKYQQYFHKRNPREKLSFFALLHIYTFSTLAHSTTVWFLSEFNVNPDPSDFLAHINQSTHGRHSIPVFIDRMNARLVTALFITGESLSSQASVIAAIKPEVYYRTLTYREYKCKHIDLHWQQLANCMDWSFHFICGVSGRIE